MIINIIPIIINIYNNIIIILILLILYLLIITRVIIKIIIIIYDHKVNVGVVVMTCICMFWCLSLI